MPFDDVLRSLTSRALGTSTSYPAPRTRRLRPRGSDIWEATGDDPQFILRVPSPAPTVLKLVVEAKEGFIDPELYLDLGNGFNEFEKIAAGVVQIAAFRLHLKDTDGLRRIRFDPSKGASFFRMRYEYNHEVGVVDWIEKLVVAAESQGQVAVLKDVFPECYDSPSELKRTQSYLTPKKWRLQARGADLWQAADEDPQFVFRVPSRAPCVLILALESAEALIEPELFLDWGDGFDESEKIPTGPVQTGVFRLRLKNTDGLRKIRLDPSKGRSFVRMRYVYDFGGRDADWAEEFVIRARAQGRVAIFKDVAAEDYASPGPNRPIGMRRRCRNAHEQYLRITNLARNEYGPKRRSLIFEGDPQISLIVPVFNTPPRYLDALLCSFIDQPTGLAELILSDDGSTSEATLKWLERNKTRDRLVIVRSKKNRGIACATNEGIACSKGRWIGFIDHDDALAAFALDMIWRAIQSYPDVKLIYTDELIVDSQMNGTDFFLKPAFDPVLLSGMNYINHFCIYRRDKLVAIDGLRVGFEGSQDYDLLLRYVAQLEPSEVLHIPYPAYMWRRDGNTYSIRQVDKATASARLALSEAYRGLTQRAKVDQALSPYLHRIRFEEIKECEPKVSIVIPNKNSFELLRCVLDGIVSGTEYQNLEIIIVDNGSTDTDVLRLYEEVCKNDGRLKVDIEASKFNFARQVNKGIRMASGEFILLLNNDIEVVERGWLKEMMACLKYPRAGIVGARLLYPDQTLQHAGVIVGLGDFAGHWFIGRPSDCPGPLGRLHVRSSLTAVTGACMLVSRKCFEKVGVLDEENFAVAYNDIDFCMRAGAAGFSVIYTPFAKLIHHESASRGVDERGPNRPRFLRDQAMLLERHGTEGYEDRAYNPWYTRDSSEPQIAILEKLPDAR